MSFQGQMQSARLALQEAEKKPTGYVDGFKLILAVLRHLLYAVEELAAWVDYPS